MISFSSNLFALTKKFRRMASGEQSVYNSIYFGQQFYLLEFLIEMPDHVLWFRVSD